MRTFGLLQQAHPLSSKVNEHLMDGVLPARGLRFPVSFQPAVPFLLRPHGFEPHCLSRGNQGSDEVVEAAFDSLSAAVAPGLALP